MYEPLRRRPDLVASRRLPGRPTAHVRTAQLASLVIRGYVRPVVRRRTSLALLVLTPLLVGSVGASAALAAASPGTSAGLAHCRDIHEQGGQTATHVLARGIGCRVAKQGVETYLGSPQGCLTSSGCFQSGVIDGRNGGVACHRRRHRVRCTVTAGSRTGVVRFVMHPIGYPGLPGTRP